MPDLSIAEKLVKVLELKNQPSYRVDMMQSFSLYFEKNGHLSFRQKEILDLVYEQNCSPETLKKLSVWESNFSDGMKSDFALALGYYSKTQYFQNIVSRHKDKPELLPSETDFKKLTENAYIRKFLKTCKEPALFAQGSLAKTRKGQPCSVIIESKKYEQLSHLKDNGLFNGNSWKTLEVGVVIIENKVIPEPPQVNKFVEVFLLTNPRVRFHIRESALKGF